MGPRTGAVIRAESIDGVAPGRDDASIDAIHALDRSLSSGDSTTFDIVTVFNPRGCNDRGTLLLHHFPDLEVSTMGVDHTITGPRTLAFHNTIRTPDCDRL
jgi:hypothetical protein